MLTASLRPSRSWEGTRRNQISDMKKLVLALLFACLAAQSAEGAQRTNLVKDLKLNDGTYAVYTAVEGVPKWRLFPYIWVDKAVTLRWNRGKVWREPISALLPSINQKPHFSNCCVYCRQRLFIQVHLCTLGTHDMPAGYQGMACLQE